MTKFAVKMHARLLTAEAGQTTVEYALVMLGVAAVAGLLLAWVRTTDLFDRMFEKILKNITP